MLETTIAAGMTITLSTTTSHEAFTVQVDVV